jgi:type I restriction enzyme S subunit
VVQPGCILISRSGTIGSTVIATEDFADKYVSDDALRVTAKSSDSRGLLYTFLQSEAGQFLITRNKSGGVVEHIYEDDLNGLGIPVLPRNLRAELTRLIDDSCALRVKANRLLDEAQEQVQRSCYLPDLDSIRPTNRLPCESDALLFAVSAIRRLGEGCGYGEVRLDATYHDPLALAVARRILQSKGGTTLGTLVQDVRNSSLRKRVYVEDADQGVPLVGGKQLTQWRPRAIKYLSKAMTRNLSEESVQNGWTVVSSGGTLGRCLYIHRNFEDWVFSQDVMRIIPDSTKVHPGFIYAFLASPYGQVQIAQRGYGSVIPRLREFQFESIAVPMPQDKGEAIHCKVVEAFNARADARQYENEAFGLFNLAIDRGRPYVESEWGEEY